MTEETSQEQFLVLICGDRQWKDRSIVAVVLQGLTAEAATRGKHLVVLHGDNGYDEDGKSLMGKPATLKEIARGADKIAGALATERGIEVIAMPADWTQFGKSAGPIRNSEMLKREPDLVIAFHDDIAASSGTLDMVNRARRAFVPCYVVRRF